MRTVSFSACVTVLVPFCREEGGSSWLDTHGPLRAELFL